MASEKTPRANKSNSSCCVPFCTVKGYVLEDQGPVSFHRLPKDENQLKTWLVKIRRDEGPNFNISKHTKVCSRHFKPDDFFYTKKGRRFLKQGAIPSVFVWTKAVPGRARSHQMTDHVGEEGSNPTVICNQPDHVPVPGEESSYALELDTLRKKVKILNEAAALFQKERDHMRSELLKSKEQKQDIFGIEKFKNSDSDMSFYTGFPNYEVFVACFDLLNPGENCCNIKYVHSAQSLKISQRQRKLKPQDEFFLVMIRLRLGMFEHHLAHIFNVSPSTVNRICLSWINFMYLRLGSINIWPSNDTIKATMPASMQEKYPSLTWIIDAFEIQCERPSSLSLASKSYSNYKSRNTLKGLIACTPSGQIGFISQLYTGSISDRELTIRSGFLLLPHKKGSMWLVDKGFQIQDLCDSLGVKINMPAFVGKNSQMSAEEVFHTQQVASERIHVERAINKVKNFHCFDRPIPLSMIGTVNQMWTVCALLTLFQNPIISA